MFLSRPIPRFLLAAALAVLCLTAPAVSRWSSQKVTGTYKIEFRGSYSGVGDARVTAQTVSISASLRDDAGQVFAFSAHNLTLKRGYLSGPATLGELQFTLAGRIEPPDDIVKSARLLASAKAPGQKFLRLAGSRTGSLPNQDPPKR